MIVEYRNTYLVGNKCFIHPDFAVHLNYFCDCLRITGCRAWITSSYRKDSIVPGAVVIPAKMSNHMIGYAIDCNIFDKSNKLWNSKKLLYPKWEVMECINKVKLKMRWGGDFAHRDPVHFDYAINLKNPDKWHEIYNQLKLQK